MAGYLPSAPGEAQAPLGLESEAPGGVRGSRGRMDCPPWR